MDDKLGAAGGRTHRTGIGEERHSHGDPDEMCGKRGYGEMGGHDARVLRERHRGHRDGRACESDANERRCHRADALTRARPALLSRRRRAGGRTDRFGSSFLSPCIIFLSSHFFFFFPSPAIAFLNRRHHLFHRHVRQHRRQKRRGAGRDPQTCPRKGRR